MRKGLAALLATALVGTTLLVIAGPAHARRKANCGGKRATIVGSAAKNTLNGTSGNDVIAGLGGNDTIRGKGGRDLICGGGGADIVWGGGGADVVTGGKGSDILFGSGGNDSIDGQGGIDIIVGMNGADQYEGGSGIDLGAFLVSGGPVTVNLEAGSASGEGNDTLSGIEGAIGSQFNDAIYGNGDLNILIGASGNDLLDGRGGTDFVYYTLAPSAITADLEDGTATGGEGSDSLWSIESAIGSEHDDVLIGTSGPNYLKGAEGDDTVDGRGGDDVCEAEAVQNCPIPLPKSADTPNGGSALDAAAKLAPSFPGKGNRKIETELAAPGYNFWCPPLYGTAHFDLPELPGNSYFAYRTIHPFTGASEWTYSAWVKWDGNWWWWFPQAGEWRSFNGTDILWGGSQLDIELWFYSQYYDEWYWMGRCTTTRFNLSPGI